ncbi:Gfo/Idh/MocA family oxidoreductase [Patescibacteria group bacterium]|nr:Gfo/Idh/MocA family oxidoreductase [Patescibacteria group bacterium]
MHNISIISDEISDNIDDVISFCKRNSLHNIELRSVSGKNLMYHNAASLKKIAKKLSANKLSVNCIASPILKWSHLGKKTIVKSFRTHGFNEKNVDYASVFELAALFKAKDIRIFSYLKYKGFKIEDLQEEFGKLIALAKKYNMCLLLENEPACNIDTVVMLDEAIRYFNSPRLKVLLDIGNLYEIGLPLKTADIKKLGDAVKCVHVKDYSVHDKKYKTIGEGSINYKKHVADLINFSGKNIIYSLETHTGESKAIDSQNSVFELRNIIASNKVSYGIVGCGRVFQKHVNAIKHTNRAVLRGVYDIDRSKAIRAAKEFDCELFRTLDDLIANVDVINICTPHHTHCNLIIAALQGGKKCLCEKPVVLNDSEAKRVRYLRGYGKNVFVVYQNRFNRAIQAVEKIIHDDILGKTLYVFGDVRWFRPHSYYKQNWRGTIHKEGGLLLNQGIHLLDILMRLGSIKDQQKIKIKNAIKKNIYHKKIQTEDIFIAQFEANKILFNIEVTVSCVPENLESSIFIIFERGSIVVGGEALNELKLVKSTNLNVEPIIENVLDIYGNGHRKLIESLTNYLLDGTENRWLTDFDNAYQSVAFANRLYKYEKLDNFNADNES